MVFKFHHVSMYSCPTVRLKLIREGQLFLGLYFKNVIRKLEIF